MMSLHRVSSGPLLDSASTAGRRNFRRSPGLVVAVLLMLAALSTPASPQAGFVQEEPSEARLREIARQLRCPVCQGETVYDSQSGLADEMRKIIREQLEAGRGNDEIVGYFVARYGESVRLAPDVGGVQLWAWILPFLAFGAGMAVVSLAIRRWHRASAGQDDI